MNIRFLHKLMMYKRRPTASYATFTFLLALTMLAWYSWGTYSQDPLLEVYPTVVSARGIIDYYPELTETYRDLGMNLTNIYDQIFPVVTRINEKYCKTIFEDWITLVSKQTKRLRKNALQRRHAEFTLNGYSFLLEENQMGVNEKFPVLSRSPKYSLEQLMEKDSDFFSTNRDKYVKGITAMQHAMHYTGLRWQRGLVFGAHTPFTEGLALKNHASHVTSISWTANRQMAEKNTPVSYLRPDDLAKQTQRLDAQLVHYDFIAAFDSLNNLGIGSFEGDPIDPAGDMKEMQKLRCLLKDSGLFYLGVPIGADCLYWNNYRIYGQIRLPLILSGFTIVNVFNSTSEEPIPLTTEIFKPERTPCLHDNFVVFILKKLLVA